LGARTEPIRQVSRQWLTEQRIHFPSEQTFDSGIRVKHAAAVIDDDHGIDQAIDQPGR
jgi:hypothetical protein